MWKGAGRRRALPNNLYPKVPDLKPQLEVCIIVQMEGNVVCQPPRVQALTAAPLRLMHAVTETSSTLGYTLSIFVCLYQCETRDVLMSEKKLHSYGIRAIPFPEGAYFLPSASQLGLPVVLYIPASLLLILPHFPCSWPAIVLVVRRSPLPKLWLESLHKYKRIAHIWIWILDCGVSKISI